MPLQSHNYHNHRELPPLSIPSPHTTPPPQGQTILPMGFPFTKSSKVNPGDSYSPIDSSPTAIHQHQKKKSTIYEDEYNPMSPRSEKRLLNIEDEDEKQKGKYGGLMKYICCGSTKKIVIFGKQPQVEFLEIGPSPNDVEAYVKTPTGFDFNVGLKIRVNNPNVIGATFSLINVVAFYPNFDKSIGGGNLTNVNIESRGNTTINFPFSIRYDKEIDPNFAILLDIASKCGLIGSSGKQKITINYTVSLSLKVLVISFPPYSIKRQVNIDCPLQDGKIPNIPGFDPIKAANDLNQKKKKK
ncbi:2377_t:CDS:2 [Entrophospora sp. SA101]|nr:2377_t:CDS:2 [Entrophospora sp. SA101]